MTTDVPIDDACFRWPQEAAPAAPGRQALLLAYFAPPHPAVASHRPEALVRWLPTYGWAPLLMTPEREGAPAEYRQTSDQSWYRAVSAGGASGGAKRSGGPLAALKQMAKGVLRRLPRWYDEYSVWSHALIPQVIAAGREHRAELVWATCNPFTLAITATQVARALGVPCVLDLRDELSGYLRYGAPQRHWFYRVLRQADALTVAAPVCATPELRGIWDDRPILPIISGMWHPERVPAVPSEQFILLHAGTLYDWRCSPQPLFEAVAGLMREQPGFARDLRMVFAGPDSDYVRQVPGYAAVAAQCEIHGMLPYREVVQRMPSASVLLIIKAPGDAVYSADPIPAKFYDYLPYEVPVLSFGGHPGLLGALLQWSHAGEWLATPEAIAAFLREAYLAWQADGVARRERAPEALAYLTQQRMAAECAEVFDAAVEGRPARTRPGPPWRV